MLMRDILEVMQLTRFGRVVVSSLHGEILELPAESCNWEEFKRQLLYCMTSHIMDWAEVERLCSRFDKRREWYDEGS